MIRIFNRFELKYIIDLQTAQNVMQDIAPQMAPDPYGGQNGYRILSLYYDSPELDFFWAKIEGLKFRRKIRIRVYPDLQADNRDKNKIQAMVEIKQRINKTVQKRRLRLNLNDAYLLCDGKFTPDTHPELSELDQQIAAEIEYIARSKQLQPSCLIDYHRMAFEGTIYNPGLRITFDTQLKCRLHDLKLESQTANHYFLPPDHCVMEVKVNDTVPDWVNSVLARHQCQLQRISKYCTGLAKSKNLPVMQFAISPWRTAS